MSVSVAQSDSCYRNPHGVSIADMTADIRLLVISKQMELDSMTAKHVADIFSVAEEFEWTQDRALWNTAVQSRGCSQNTSVRDGLQTADTVRLEPG